MNKFKDFLVESSLNRLWEMSRKHDYGTITAHRSREDCGTGAVIPMAEKKKRNASLTAKLLAKGYSVTGIKGSYIENYGSDNAIEVGERSFFVVDIADKKNLKETLLSLGELFEQDSIIFGEAGKGGDLIGTNHCPDGYPGYGKTSVAGGAIFGKSGEFMSRVKGRPFVFSESLVLGDIEMYGSKKTPTERRSVVPTSHKHWSDLSEEEVKTFN